MEKVYITWAEATTPLDPEVLSKLVDFTRTCCEISRFHSILAREGFWVGESHPVDVDGEVGANFPVYRLIDKIRDTSQIGYMLTIREECEDPNY